jgi:peroxiredoxin
MPWVYFDPFDRNLPLPDFVLETLTEDCIQLSSYRGLLKPVIYFPGKQPKRDYQNLVNGYRQNLDQYHQEDAVIFIILPRIPQYIERLIEIEDSQLRILIDFDGEVRQRYSELLAPGMFVDKDEILFIADQYGGPYAAWISKTEPGKDFQKDIINWLEFIGIQCPE